MPKGAAGNVDQTLDRTAYDMYNSATTSLKGVADELATNGLSPELRGRIKSVARDYKTTMDALNDAQTRLYAEQDRRAKLGPDYVYQQNDLRIGDFLNGATPNQKGESLSKISKDIGLEFESRAQRITQDTWNRAFSNNGKVIAGYYDVSTQSGLSSAQLDTILSDTNTWNSIMRDPSISDSQKALLQGFRNVIDSKKRALDYDKYDSYERAKINDAIAVGAHGGLGKVTHEYKKDESYDPLGWANYHFRERQYNDALAEQEAGWNHEPNKPISPATRTTLKEGYGLNPKGVAVPKDTLTPTSSNSKSPTSRLPYIGVMYFDKSGNSKSYGSDKEWNESQTKFSGKIVTDGSELNERNLVSLSSVLGLGPINSAEYVLEEAARRGIIVSIEGSGDKQKMVLRGTKTYISNAAPEEETEFNVDG